MLFWYGLFVLLLMLIWLRLLFSRLVRFELCCLWVLVVLMCWVLVGNWDKGMLMLLIGVELMIWVVGNVIVMIWFLVNVGEYRFVVVSVVILLVRCGVVLCRWLVFLFEWLVFECMECFFGVLCLLGLSVLMVYF